MHGWLAGQISRAGRISLAGCYGSTYSNVSVVKSVTPVLGPTVEHLPRTCTSAGACVEKLLVIQTGIQTTGEPEQVRHTKCSLDPSVTQGEVYVI